MKSAGGSGSVATRASLAFQRPVGVPTAIGAHEDLHPYA